MFVKINTSLPDGLTLVRLQTIAFQLVTCMTHQEDLGDCTQVVMALDRSRRFIYLLVSIYFHAWHQCHVIVNILVLCQLESCPITVLVKVSFPALVYQNLYLLSLYYVECIWHIFAKCHLRIHSHIPSSYSIFLLPLFCGQRFVPDLYSSDIFRQSHGISVVCNS